MSEKEIGTLQRKFKEFERNGLEKWRDYLLKEVENSKDNSLKAAYHKYCIRELENAEGKIQKINSDLNS